MSNRFEALYEAGVLYGIVSGPKSSTKETTKVKIHPFVKKGEPLVQYQFSLQKGNKEVHLNLNPSEAAKKTEELLLSEFSQALLCTEDADWHIVSLGTLKWHKKPPTRKAEPPAAHDRQKPSLIEENADFLQRLGVSTAAGVLKGKRDKFRQINRYLEIIDRCIPSAGNRPLRVLDFGCGKAYLTFALYHYLTQVRGITCEISGLDLKQDVIEYCNSVAKDLHYQHLQFHVGDIAEWQTTESLDMVITLHACDTATDYAIAKAVTWNASTILTVPCCQHELFSQIQSTVQRPLLKHGILKERISALVTDATRAQLLEALGYSVDVIEFIDLEHTPKNLMIRAIRADTSRPLQMRPEKLAEYEQFASFWGVNPCLRDLLPR